MGAHIVDGQFQSDKYPTCPPGKVPLSVKDVTAQDLLWIYAQRRRLVDAEFADDLETALRKEGYEPGGVDRDGLAVTGTLVAGTLVIECAGEVHRLPRVDVRYVKVEQMEPKSVGCKLRGAPWQLTYVLVGSPARHVTFGDDGRPPSLRESVEVDAYNGILARELMRHLTRGTDDLWIVQRSDGSWKGMAWVP